MCTNICESIRDKNTMKALIQIPHLELILFFFLTKINAGNKSSFFFAWLKLQGRRNKNKNNN